MLRQLLVIVGPPSARLCRGGSVVPWHILLCCKVTQSVGAKMTINQSPSFKTRKEREKEREFRGVCGCGQLAVHGVDASDASAIRADLYRE